VSLQFSETVTGAVTDGVLLVTIDNPPVNAASVDMRQGLFAAIEHAAAADEIAAVVVAGAGKTFVGGADIREFGKPMAEPLLPQVVNHVEASDKPVVAAINGAALGGGLEIALGCHHRVASSTARLGLPEVKLGIVPGAGGTQRLPRLAGVVAAAEIAATGRMVGVEEACALGIVDAVAQDELLAQAVAAARSLAGKPPRRTGDLPVPAMDGEAFDSMAAKVLARARGQDAPAEALRLVRSAAERTLAEGLVDERATFRRLSDSDQSKALRHAFFAERAAAKVEGLEGVEPRPVARIGIVGLGLMGSGIAIAALDAGYDVTGVDTTVEAAAKGRERIAALLDRNLASGRLDADGRAQRLARLATSDRIEDLADVDLVIEAVFDDLTVKTELFRRLDAVIRSDAILATNTSYLDSNALADATTKPERVVGLHFFSPANIMRLVEVVDCAMTAPDVLATGLAVAKKLGKLPVVSGVTEGFIGNSIFSAYRREAEFLLEDGALPQEIDAAMEAYGFAMGPFAVFDLAGLDIAWARRKRQAATRDPNERYVDIADRLCEAGRFGRKTERGWYAYPQGKRTVDPEVTALIEAARAKKHIAPRRIEADEIVSRLLGAMAVEGEKLLAGKIALRASDIDLVMINGYGFPAHKGGPMFAAGKV
jgi:3-hydroxyacyl-CoA dehydrogenase